VHILIFEVALSGHHANYLTHLVQLFLDQGYRVSIGLLGEYHSDSSIERLLTNFPGRLKLVPLVESKIVNKLTVQFGVVGAEISRWFLFRRAYLKLKSVERIDQVFFPYLDYCLYATSLLGSPTGCTPWAGICMRPSFHFSKVGVNAPTPKWRAIKQQLFYRLLKRSELRALYTIDETLKQYVTKIKPSLSERLFYLPDPAELSERYTKESARSLLNLSTEEFIILVYGVINERKGVQLIINTIRGQKFPKPVRVLVVGQHTSLLNKQLCQELLVTSINHYVNSDVEEAVFRAVDVVWMGYYSHYSMSGVLILAAISRRPVIATSEGLIGWMTEQYNLGVIVDCKNEVKLRKVLNDFMSQSHDPERFYSAKIIAHRHSWKLFNQTILTGFLTNKPS
jgi:glycosyltransferase involved in cell wall biosynthesis